MRKVLLKDLTPEEIIKRLRKGEVIKCEDSNKITYLIDGIIVSEELLLENGENVKHVIFGSHFFVNYKVDYLYFEEEEPFKITETGFYKTRDGRKVYVSDVENYAYGVVDGERRIRNWSLEGRWAVTNLDDIDIVAKWED